MGELGKRETSELRNQKLLSLFLNTELKFGFPLPDS